MTHLWDVRNKWEKSEWDAAFASKGKASKVVIMFEMFEKRFQCVE